MSCPNSDPEFNKIIGQRTPYERSMLFLACVATRFILYSGVYMYRDRRWVRWIVGLFSALSVAQLARPSSERQWWSKKFQMVMALLVILGALFDPDAMSAFLFISLAGGIIQRLHVTLC